MNTDVNSLVAQSHLAIKQGSKSFTAAGYLLGPAMRDAAFMLYRWCRHCDDEIDLKSSSPTNEQLARLEQLKLQTQAAFDGQSIEHPVFQALALVVNRYKIPRHYAMELLEGMAMDIRCMRYESVQELELYCYRVAGTVGLMMSHIMGLSTERALEHACSMGSAMQLTNIARDIFEDARMGRVYLPLAWLREENLDQDKILSQENRPKLVRIVRRLLGHAQAHYCHGDVGVRYLSFRAACAIQAARYIYSEIGNEVVRRGEEAWTTRVWTSKARKVVLLAKAILRTWLTLPSRCIRPWSPTVIKTVWPFAQAKALG